MSKQPIVSVAAASRPPLQCPCWYALAMHEQGDCHSPLTCPCVRSHDLGCPHPQQVATDIHLALWTWVFSRHCWWRKFTGNHGVHIHWGVGGYHQEPSHCKGLRAAAAVCACSGHPWGGGVTGEGRACQASREQALSLLVKVGAAGCTQDFCAGVLELRCGIECQPDLSASLHPSAHL